MTYLRFFLLLSLIILLTTIRSLATWSVIIIDPITKEIGIAGASCSPDCYGIGDVVPGKGAVIVQAMSNNAARAKALEMIAAGASPAEILNTLMDPVYDPERQQYAIITFEHITQAATYSGSLTHETKGAFTANGISVQGNTLAGEAVLREVFNAVLKGRSNGMPMHEMLMLAMQVGADAGGDKRCGEQRATSAFLTIFSPSKRKPLVKLSVFNQTKGGQNSVTLLQKQYERWRSRNVGKKSKRP